MGSKVPGEHRVMTEKIPVSLYVDHPGEPLLDHVGEPLSEVSEACEFGRVPLNVTSDPRLMDRDIRVYAVIASPIRKGGKISSIGTRRISELSCVARRLVIDSVKRLVKCGHIKAVDVDDRVRGKRSEYTMTSVVFTAKESKWTGKAKGKKQTQANIAAMAHRLTRKAS